MRDSCHKTIFWKLSEYRYQLLRVALSAFFPIICCKRYYHGQIGRPGRTKGIGDGIQRHVLPWLCWAEVRIPASGLLIISHGFESYIRIWIFWCSCYMTGFGLFSCSYYITVYESSIPQCCGGHLRLRRPILHSSMSHHPSNVYLGLDCWAVEIHWFTEYSLYLFKKIISAYLVCHLNHQWCWNLHQKYEVQECLWICDTFLDRT